MADESLEIARLFQGGETHPRYGISPDCRALTSGGGGPDNGGSIACAGYDRLKNDQPHICCWILVKVIEWFASLLCIFLLILFCEYGMDKEDRLDHLYKLEKTKPFVYVIFMVPPLLVLFLMWWFYHVQGRVVAVGLFRRRLQIPILDWYASHGRQISAVVISRHEEKVRRCRDSRYDLVLGFKFTPDSSIVHGKRITVPPEDFQLTTLDIIVFPDIASSAVSKKIYEDRTSSRRTATLRVAVFTTLIIWLFLFRYVAWSGCHVENEDRGLFAAILVSILFALSWIKALCTGFSIIFEENEEMLIGKFPPISPHLESGVLRNSRDSSVGMSDNSDSVQGQHLVVHPESTTVESIEAPPGHLPTAYATYLGTIDHLRPG